MINEINLDFFYDDNRFLKLTNRNYTILNCICTKIDSNYRNDFNPNNKESARHIIKEFSESESPENWLKCREKVEKVCKAIDKENSTHLIISGNKGKTNGNKNPDNSRGIELMVDKIIHYDSLLDKIREGNGDVVNDLAVAATLNNNTISKFSFASKFCTYISRYQFNGDNYCIYDNVVQGILPYYVYMYLGIEKARKYCRNSKSTVYEFRDKFKYNEYRNLIDEVILNSPLNVFEKPRQMFDMILWYYYKGDKDLIKEAICSITRQ